MVQSIMFVPCSIHPHSNKWDDHPTRCYVVKYSFYGELWEVSEDELLMCTMVGNKMLSSITIMDR